MTTVENIDIANLDKDMTVEQFLKKQCDEQIQRLRKHSEDLVKQFESESQEVRKKLVQRLAPPK